ncbi:MAG: family 20 glycosylhydrolase [Pseudothermotoga sp.]|uniref:beta-N-acetylhexosaminidase n=1 Tax=Pseudothermotoga sp. TaxID=2033661 RepID=UPI000A75B084|nr:family 20 glycosylhydrolase [Pseudothermotoga sp.]HBT40458.1 glycoside hydrolase [Pseudothermotoga sp.]HCO97295.1 glycoside hydrolase [Pseudothermotoga sp.]
MIPVVKKLTRLGGIFKLPESGKIFTGTESFGIAKILKQELSKRGKDFSIVAHSRHGSTFELLLDGNLINHPQGYRIILQPSKVSFVAATNQGLFYALQTFKQLLREQNDALESAAIEDEPDFENRAFMLDISRNRVPKMETLKKLVELLSELKYNQLQLYMEHTFAYEKHEKVWRDYSPLTHEEILELDEYCRERFIELVPNQNCFGHLEKWLIHDEYRHLAECPDGFVFPWGVPSGPFSLSPAVEESLKFVESLLEELLPHFSSSKVNVGADETFDLGLGRSKELCEKFGKGRVYLNFLLGLYRIVKRHGRTMMFWGDIIKNYPKLVGELPNDVIALLWGYEEDHPYETECELFASKGISFYVCPGTSSWNSFVGRLDNALGNVRNAIRNGKKFNALGFLLTDWGDNGHTQHFPVSILPIVYAATLGWNVSVDFSTEELLKQTDVHVFGIGSLSEKLHTLGNMYKNLSVQLPNASVYFTALMFPERFLENLDALDENDVEAIKEALQQVEDLIRELLELRNESSRIFVDQIVNNARMLGLAMEWMLLAKEYERIDRIGESIWKDFATRFAQVVEEYKKLWLESNRLGGLNQSVEKLTRLLKLK